MAKLKIRRPYNRYIDTVMNSGAATVHDKGAALYLLRLLKNNKNIGISRQGPNHWIIYGRTPITKYDQTMKYTTYII